MRSWVTFTGSALLRRTAAFHGSGLANSAPSLEKAWHRPELDPWRRGRIFAEKLRGPLANEPTDVLALGPVVVGTGACLADGAPSKATYVSELADDSRLLDCHRVHSSQPGSSLIGQASHRRRSRSGSAPRSRPRRASGSPRHPQTPSRARAASSPADGSSSATHPCAGSRTEA